MVASAGGHEVVVETLLKARATVDMQNKVYYVPEQCLLEYHPVPYCTFNSAILNSSTLPVIEYTDNSLHDTDLAIVK